MLLRPTLRKFLVLAVAFAALLGLGATPAGAEPPLPGRQLLFYNHAYGVLDRETADAIANSAYLREFANFQLRTTTGAGGQTWTGRYLLGHETYLELFGEGDLPAPDDNFGSTGMGLSTERAGDLATVVQRLTAMGIANPVEFDQTRDFGDGVPVPWFTAVFTTDQYDRFGAWGMEYRPEYFADPRSDTEPPNYPGDVGRERYLSDGYRDHLMRDVSGIRLAVTARDLANTVPLLRAGGFLVASLPNGAVATRGGTTLRFDAVPLAEVGLKQVEFALNRPVVGCHEERIGRSTLAVGPGPRAVWTFAGPA
jgi:hypothetical protein